MVQRTHAAPRQAVPDDRPDLSAASGRTLRIAVIAGLRHGLREPYAGGLERQTADLARGLRAAGHQITVFASGDCDEDLGVQPIAERSSLLDLSPAARLDVSMLSENFMVEHDAYLRLLIGLRTAPFDIIHDNSLHYLPVAMAGDLPMPLVKVLHTPPTPWIEAALRRRSANTTLVSVSRDNAGRWPGGADHVVYNAIDLARFTPSPVHDVGRAVWVGRLCPEKAPHEAVLAAQMAGFDLDIIGPASDPTYTEEVLLPVLDERRRWIGHKGTDEVALAMARAAVVMVTPVWPEPFGLVVMEALACGTPVAGYANGALPEIVTDEVAALAEPGDVAGLAEALQAATALNRVACRRHAEAVGSINRMVNDYERLYWGLTG